jgi:hypothetical protein
MFSEQLRYAPRVDHAFDVYAMPSHAIQDNARVKSSSFDRGEEFILSCALQVWEAISEASGQEDGARQLRARLRKAQR